MTRLRAHESTPTPSTWTTISRVLWFSVCLPTFRTLVSKLPHLAVAVGGASTGLLLLIPFSRLRLAVGGASLVQVCLLLTVALTMLLCQSFLRRGSRVVALIGCWGLVLWSLLHPAILSTSLTGVERYALSQLANPWTEAMIFFVLTLASLAVPVACAVAIGLQLQALRLPYLIGIAGCWLLLPASLGTVLSLTPLVWGSLVFLVFAGAFVVNRSTLDERLIPGNAPVDAAIPPETTSPMAFWEQAFRAGLIGLAVAMATFVGRQLVLDHVLSEAALAGGFLLGCGLCTLSVRRSPLSRWSVLCLWGAGLILLYPQLTNLVIWQSTWISNPVLLYWNRALLLALLTLPLGWSLGSVACPAQNGTLGSNSRTPSPLTRQALPTWGSCLLLCLGMTSAIRSGVSLVTAAYILIGIATSVLLGLSIWQRFGALSREKECTSTAVDGLSASDKSASPLAAPAVVLPIWRQRVSRAGSLSLALIILAALFSPQRLDLRRSEKTVYAGNVFHALRNGVASEKWMWLDDGRHVAVAESLEHRLSFWKHNGLHLLSRQNGLPLEQFSIKPEVSPRHVSELLPSLVSILTHAEAEHVLLLGMHRSSLEVCDAFPLHSVTVLDDALPLWERQHAFQPTLIDPERYRFTRGSIPLALKTQHSQPYDVIITPQLIPGTSAAAARLTGEYFADVRKLLSPDGMLCQRIACYDLGPEILQQIVGTAAVQFPQVVVMEALPGELLLLASLREETLITPEFIARLQLPEVRRLLGTAGWDWSLAASRGTLDQAAVQAWLDDKQLHLTCREADLAFQLPIEVARWGNKLQASRESLAQKAKSLVEFLGEGEELQDVSQRLEDLKLAQQILNEEPDNVWGYRAALKKQLTDRPRAKIMQVSGEGLARRLHPDDQHRKDYLVTVGKIAQAEQPTSEMLDQLARFQSQFDPLLASFVSHEAVHHSRRRGETPDARHWQHLLISITYSSPGDQSVRNVCEAINILCRQPELVDGPDTQWDQLNSLLEVLAHRWDLRLRDERRSLKFETIDTERSIAAVEAAIESLEAGYPAVGLTSNAWHIRRDIIEQGLLQPLQRHRSKQLRTQRTVVPLGP